MSRRGVLGGERDLRWPWAAVPACLGLAHPCSAEKGGSSPPAEAPTCTAELLLPSWARGGALLGSLRGLGLWERPVHWTCLTTTDPCARTLAQALPLGSCPFQPPAVPHRCQPRPHLCAFAPAVPSAAGFLPGIHTAHALLGFRSHILGGTVSDLPAISLPCFLFSVASI